MPTMPSIHGFTTSLIPGQKLFFSSLKSCSCACFFGLDLAYRSSWEDSFSLQMLLAMPQSLGKTYTMQLTCHRQ